MKKTTGLPTALAREENLTNPGRYLRDAARDEEKWTTGRRRLVHMHAVR